MARITVEDCLEKVENQYDLVLLAKERTVQLNAGAPMMVEEDNDKRTIISLREIGDGKIDVNKEILHSSMSEDSYEVPFLRDIDNYLIVKTHQHQLCNKDSLQLGESTHLYNPDFQSSVEPIRLYNQDCLFR